MPFDFLKPKTNKTIHKYPTDFLLGDLLVKSGVISDAQLEEAVKLAGNKHLHVGQMLIMAGYISPRDLQAAVDAQSLLRDRAIDSAMAAKCLKIACKTGMSLADVVRDQDQAASSANSTNRLGEILLEANLIDADQFAKAMQRSMSTGLPLGRILVLNGALQESVLTLALELQVRIRDGMSTRLEAVQALAQAAGVDPVSQEQTMNLEGMGLAKPPRRKGVRIGELMVLAGLLAETDVMNCVELGLVHGCPIGQMMVEQGFTTPEILEAALELQRRMDDDQLEPMEAAEILSKIRATGQEVEAAIEEHQRARPEEPKQNVGFEKLLLLARVVSEDDVESALQQAATSPQVLSRVLNLTGYIDEHTMQAVLQAYTMMTNGFLSQDDTIIALDYCLHKPAETRVTFGQALSELGWNAMVPLQMQSAHSVDISQVRLAAMQAPDQKATAQDYAESTLGALAEIESAAKDINDAAAEESNGQAESSEFQGREEAEREEEAAAIEEALRAVGLATADSDEVESPSAPLSEAARELAALDLAAAESGLRLEQASPERIVEALDEALEEAAEHASAAMALQETSEQLEAELAAETAVVEVVLEVVETRMVEEAAAAAASIDSAALLAAELAKMSGTEEIIAQLRSGEHGFNPAGAREPAGEEEVASGFKAVAEPEIASPPELSVDEAASLIAEITAKASTAEPVAASAAASLLADLEGAAAQLSDSAPPGDVSEMPRAEEAAANELLAQLEASNAAAAAEPAEQVLEDTSPGNGSDGRRDALADLFSSALSELAGKDKAAEPPAKDTQRALPRKNEEVAADLIHADTFNVEDEVSLRDLFSERLTEPLFDDADEVVRADQPVGDDASAAAADQAARTAQELMEELLSRAAADEVSKKEEASRAESEARAQRAAEEKLKREAEQLEAEAKRESELRAATQAAEAKAKQEAQEKARKEAEEKARKEAEEKARKEAEEKAHKEAEEKARKEVEELARKEAEERARRDAEELQRRVEQAKRGAMELRETEARKKQEAEELMKRQSEDLKRLDAEEQERKQARVSELAAKAEVNPAKVAEPAAASGVPVAAAKVEPAPVDNSKKADFWGSVVPQAAPTAAEFHPDATGDFAAFVAPEPVLPKADQPGNASPPPASAASAKGAAQAEAAKSPAAPEAAAAKSAPASEVQADAKVAGAKNAELLAAATRAAKAVEQAAPGSAAKEELKGALITSLSRLAESYYEQGDYAEAQGLYERILMLRQSQLGPKHSSLGADLTNLAGVLCVQGKFAQAEPFVKRVVGIVESTEPLDHMKLADSISTLAGIMFQQGKYHDCEPLLERALKVKQEKLGSEHPEVADNLRDYAKLLKKLGRDADAERVYSQAKAILAKRPKQPA